MNQAMAQFLLEIVNIGVKTQTTLDAPGTIFNPYNQFPKWRPSGLTWMDRRHIRQFGNRYNLGNPNWTKPGIGHASAIIARSVSAPALVATSGVATIVANTTLAKEKNYVPTYGQGSGMGSSFSYGSSLGF